MKYFFVLNPGSKSGTSRKRFKAIFDMLDIRGLEYDYEVTNTLEDAFAMSRYANEKADYHAIVAVGGDGTINRVLNGFFNEDGRRISSAKMGVVYTGTSPDFCKSYGIPLSLEKAVGTLIEDKSIRVSVGKIKLASSIMKEYDARPVNSDPIFKTRYFACCANAGLGAELARRANSGIRGVIGDRLGTFVALLKTLFSYTPVDFMVKVDGEIQRIEKVYNISIGRTYHIASGIKVKNRLSPEDNTFYKLVAKDMALADLPRVIKKVYSGKHIHNDKNLSLDYCRTFEILGNSNCPEVEFDGDPAGFLPCRIETAAECLELICTR